MMSHTVRLWLFILALLPGLSSLSSGQAQAPTPSPATADDLRILERRLSKHADALGRMAPEAKADDRRLITLASGVASLGRAHLFHLQDLLTLSGKMQTPEDRATARDALHEASQRFHTVFSDYAKTVTGIGKSIKDPSAAGETSRVADSLRLAAEKFKAFARP